MKHIPVLLNETIDALDLQPGMMVVDATLGDGGHFIEAWKKIGSEGILLAFDVDIIAIKNVIGQYFSTVKQKKIADKIIQVENVFFINENFGCLEAVLDQLKIQQIDAIMADLGWRSEQIDNANYGLSFLQTGPLDMRLDQGLKENQMTAADIINNWSESKLVEIFQTYGEERQATVIAREIMRQRMIAPITTTTQLAEIVKNKVKTKYPKSNSHKLGKKTKIHPATKIFQSLRIAVNRELENLEKFLPQALHRLSRNGRMAMITFHSLEDRLVKQFFRTNARGCVCPREIPVCVCGQKPRIKLITKKPIIAGMEELHRNSRSRSAKLRVIEKINPNLIS